jgi:hypothetical protein
MTTTVDATPPDLTQFLLPLNENDTANNFVGIPRPLKTRGDKTTTTTTTGLYNAANPYRLPHRMVHNPDLPLKMINALQSILQNNAQHVNITKVGQYWAVYRDFEKEFETNGSEAEIKELSSKLLDVICGCIKAINDNQRIKHKGEYRRDGPVKTDHAILTTDAAENEENAVWDPVIIVEDKATSVMASHLKALLEIPPDTFRTTRQMNWEKAPSIVAKVRPSESF